MKCVRCASEETSVTGTTDGEGFIETVECSECGAEFMYDNATNAYVGVYDDQSDEWEIF